MERHLPVIAPYPFRRFYKATERPTHDERIRCLKVDELTLLKDCQGCKFCNREPYFCTSSKTWFVACEYDDGEKCSTCSNKATQRRGREKTLYCDTCAKRLFDKYGNRLKTPTIKNRYRLSESDVAHLQMNNAFSTRAFQKLLNWQREQGRGVFCRACRSIALKIGMQPKGGWIDEMDADRWHKFHSDLDFGGDQ